MQKIIIGNWKMYGEPAMAHALTQAVADAADKLPDGIEVVLCPPAILASQVTTWLVGSVVKTGGQDCHIQPEGAYTGDISATMLKEAGCAYVIVGHSERRQNHGETNEIVRQKAARAIKTGLIPIICIGETEAERAIGQAEEVVGRQVKECVPAEKALNPAGFANFLLAYEPVWAIGSGKLPTVGDIAQMHTYIVSAASKYTGLMPHQVQVVYGGSVKADNACSIIKADNVSGVLVGGASVKAEEFCKIIAAAG